MKKYNYDEVLKATLEYFEGDNLAATIWIQKYALKDAEGNIYEKTPDDMHHRIAREFARVEKKYPNPLSEDEIYELLKNFRYIVPQGSPMAGIGNNFQIMSISNCFVTGDGGHDSYGGIMWTDQQLAQLYKRRSGCGTDLSHIRPRNTKVTNAALSTTGVVPFMERYSNTTREVAMEGRRGALLLSYHIKGMDAADFINAKSDHKKVTGANISIKISDEFINAVKNNSNFVQQFPINAENPTFTREINAKSLWDNIVHNAWANAEPGLLMWDTVTRESIGDCYASDGFSVISTNPCGEILLPFADSCRLLLLNLINYIENPFTPQAYFNRDLFLKHAIIAERLMDDVVDLELEKIDQILSKVNADPEPEHIKLVETQLWNEIKEKAIKGRRTGLGITALGDMIASMNLKYGTEEGTDFADNVLRDLMVSSYNSSVLMAKERGSFSIYDYEKEKNNPFINRLFEIDPNLKTAMKQYGRRGISLNTISPAGTVSILTRTSSGVEPVFALRYKRRRKINPNESQNKSMFVDQNGDHWEEYDVLHPPFSMWLKSNGYNVSEVSNASNDEFNAIVSKSPYHKAGANDIDWREKVKMLGKLQRAIDHSISNTCNLPSTATEQDVNDLYMLAWEYGCKGVTVYRDGSRSGVLVTSETEKKKEHIHDETHAVPRPKVVDCDVKRFTNNNEKWIAFLGIVDGRPYEIFTGLSEEFPIPTFVEKGKLRRVKDNGHGSRYDFLYIDKGGYEQTVIGLNRVFNPEFWVYAKLISGLLRNRMHLLSLIHTVESLNSDNDVINTWFNGVVRTLKKYIKDGTKDIKSGVCPDCGGTMVFSEGCLKCISCGNAKCG